MLKMLKTSAAFGAIATFFGISAGSTPAYAQIETSYGTFAPSITATSNYIFRGLSQSKKGPAIQGNLEYTYAVGDFTPYLGVFASTVSFPANNTPTGQQTIRQWTEVDFFGGVRYATPLAGLTLDAGFISYTYPNNTADQNVSGGANTYGNPQWNEVYGKFGYDFGLATAVGSVYYAKDFSYAGGQSWYYEGGFDVPLPFSILLSGRVGHQTIENNYSFGAPDYMTWNVGLAREFDFPITFTLSALYSDTNIKKGSSLGLDKISGTTGTLQPDAFEQTKGQFSISLTKKF
jgi:uncharacterized protein (TIGR02001 family)